MQREDEENSAGGGWVFIVLVCVPVVAFRSDSDAISPYRTYVHKHKDHEVQARLTQCMVL